MLFTSNLLNFKVTQTSYISDIIKHNILYYKGFLIRTENVDRLSVILTASNVEQVHGVPHLSSGTGKEILQCMTH